MRESDSPTTAHFNIVHLMQSTVYPWQWLHFSQQQYSMAANKTQHSNGFNRTYIPKYRFVIITIPPRNNQPNNIYGKVGSNWIDAFKSITPNIQTKSIIRCIKWLNTYSQTLNFVSWGEIPLSLFLPISPNCTVSVVGGDEEVEVGNDDDGIQFKSVNDIEFCC